LGVSLDAIAPDPTMISRILAAADRNIADARLPDLSSEGRFDLAYKGIMQLAVVALNANGYRTLSSRPGHHQTAIQTLTNSVGFARNKVILLDALRKQRNLADYTGETISDAAAAQCIASALELRAHVLGWIEAHKPELLPSPQP
jgi:hypothetical protein